MVTLFARLMMLVTLALILVLTVGPVELRSASPVSPEIDRALAFAFFAFFTSIAFPAHHLLSAVALAVVIVGLEYSQTFAAFRHARDADIVQKAFGAVIGYSAGFAAILIRRALCHGRHQRRQPRVPSRR